MSADLSYRDFYYPLNVFMHVLSHEEAAVPYLHYGIWEQPGDTLIRAQERSTELLFERLPPPPARILEVGIGLGTTLALLTAKGYDALGITPDEKQITYARERYGENFPVQCAAFETLDTPFTFDVLVFQESSQYIDSEALFARAETLAPLVIVLDEFSLRPLAEPGALRPLRGFLDAAAAHGFEVTEEIDLSEKAAPTIQYFIDRLPKYRQMLIDDLGLSSEQIDELIANGDRYLARYRDGTYGYRLMSLRRAKMQSRHMKSSGASSTP